MARSLASQFGSAECSLVPCPGWDADALFPSPTLRVEGSWSVGAVAWGCRRGDLPSKSLPSPPRLAARSPKTPSGDPQPLACIAPIADRAPACAPPHPLRSRLAGDLPGAPALLIAHLLAGGVWPGAQGALAAACTHPGLARELQHPEFVLPKPHCPRPPPHHAGPCFFLRPKAADPAQLPRP